MEVSALDFETVPFSPENMAPPPVCLTYIVGDSEAKILHWSVAKNVIVDLLSSNRPIAIANASYDMSVIIHTWPDLADLVFDAYDRGIIKDVLIREKLIDIALGEYRARGVYSLKRLAKTWCKVDLDKDNSPRLDYERFLYVPIEKWPENHIRYALDDVRYHKEVYLAQQRDLEEDSAEYFLNDEDRQARADLALNLASVRGIMADPVAVEALKTRSIVRMDELRPELLTAGFLEPNRKGGYTKKKKPAQKRLMESAGGDWAKVKITKTGKEKQDAGLEWQILKYISTDAEACEDSGDPLLEKLAEYSQLDSLLSGHIKALEKGFETPIHTDFEVLMETGRTSSSDPNIQNVRRAEGARECFIPRPGFAFIGCDYDKAELHTLAQVCINKFNGRSHLAEVLNKGTDPHTELGARLAGVDYEEALRRLDAGDGEMEKWRQFAKIANFGFPGGLGPDTLRAQAKKSYGVILTLEEAKNLRKVWREQWPIVVEYLDNIEDEEDVKHFGSERWRGGASYCAIANSYFQGMAADGAKLALWNVTKATYNPKSPLYGSGIVNFIHDEILLETPLHRIDEAAKALKKIMVDSFNVYTKDVPVRATPCAMDRWSKKAKPIYGIDKHLQIWKGN